MGISSTHPQRVSVLVRVSMASDKSPAEYFTEYFICSFVFIVSVFQGTRGESIQKHSKQQP